MDPVTGVISGIFGLFGAKKDRDNSLEAVALQNRGTMRQMKTSRKWQVRDNLQSRKWALQDSRRARRLAVKDARKLRKQSRQDQMSYWERHRLASEKAGFNPLATLGMTPNAQTSAGGGIMAAGGGGAGAMGVPGGAAVMGSNYMQAAAMLGEGLGASIDLAAQNMELRSQNQQMNETMRDITLRPKVGGIYAANERYPSRMAAMGGGDGSVVEGSTPVGQGTSNPANPSLGNLLFGYADNWLYGDREVRREPVVNTSGLNEIENGATGGPVSYFGNDGDPWDLSENAAVFLQTAPQVAKNHYFKYIGTPFAEWAQPRIDAVMKRASGFSASQYRGQRNSFTPMGYSFPYYE